MEIDELTRRTAKAISEFLTPKSGDPDDACKEKQEAWIIIHEALRVAMTTGGQSSVRLNTENTCEAWCPRLAQSLVSARSLHAWQGKWRALGAMRLEFGELRDALAWEGQVEAAKEATDIATIAIRIIEQR